MSKLLSEKIALVTGASSGIGWATASSLAEAGATVILAARRESRLQELQQQIAHAGGSALAIPTDVTDQAALKALFARISTEFGGLDLLVGVAGFGVAAPFHETTADEATRMVELNYLALVHTVQVGLPLLRARGNGHIVLLSSGVGRFIHPSTIYSGTKHAVSAMAESLRRELAPSAIRVTCVEPGATRSEFIDQMRPDVRDNVLDRLGDMEVLASEDIADAILYAVTRPAHVNVSIMTIYPTAQP